MTKKGRPASVMKQWVARREGKRWGWVREGERDGGCSVNETNYRGRRYKQELTREHLGLAQSILWLLCVTNQKIMTPVLFNIQYQWGRLLLAIFQSTKYIFGLILFFLGCYWFPTIILQGNKNRQRHLELDFLSAFSLRLQLTRLNTF